MSATFQWHVFSHAETDTYTSETMDVMEQVLFLTECDGSLAREVITSREFLGLNMYGAVVKVQIQDALSVLVYACEHPTRRKRTQMDVDAMVERWLPLIRDLAVAHDIDTRDAASSELDGTLRPILDAPVVEIRLFYNRLVDRMKADPTIPWAVWKLFEFWGKNVLSLIDKEEVEGLKTKLAEQIAESVAKSLPKSDWVDSMVGALRWRDPVKLEKIKTALDAGAKPRVRGKESCLFLKVGDHEVML